VLAVLDVQRVGISVEPYPSGYIADGPELFSLDLLYPSTAALTTSEIALHEYVGIAAERMHISG